MPKKGKEVIDYEVENALQNSALTGNTTAQIFWLKTDAQISREIELK